MQKDLQKQTFSLEYVFGLSSLEKRHLSLFYATG